jgi:hypothetical protein
MTKRRSRKADMARLQKLYNKRSRQWGERYIMRNLWRIQAMYDYEDVKQDAFFVFLRTYRYYPDLPEDDLFRIYKAGIRGRLHNRARECFPNSYAYEEGKGKLVLDINECSLTHFVEHELVLSLDVLSDLIEKLPQELAEVLKLLIRDFVGVACIEQRKVRRLSGRTRLEPLGVALTRILRLDPTRDLFDELDKAFSVQPIAKEYSENVH